MGGRFQRDAGGIRRLLTLLKEHREAVEYDLITLGRNLDDLGTYALSWRDLHVIVNHSPLKSAVNRAVYGDLVAWDWTEHLLAAVVDHLAWLVWAQTVDGAKGRNQPEPIWRPGDEVTEIVEASMTLDDVDEWLGWTPPRELESATTNGGPDV